MNSGKSTALLQAAYNYEERGHRVLLAKPRIDVRGESLITSRLGVTRNTDFTIGADEDAYARFIAEREAASSAISCLLVDEAQFLSERQVDDLLRIAVIEDTPVLAYGIRTDFQTVAFPGSRRLLEISHSLEELKTICRCGRKAVFNARQIGGVFTFDGDQVAIDASMASGAEVSYESLCGQCYLEESNGQLGSVRRRVLVEPAETAYGSAPDPDFT